MKHFASLAIAVLVFSVACKKKEPPPAPAAAPPSPSKPAPTPAAMTAPAPAPALAAQEISITTSVPAAAEAYRRAREHIDNFRQNEARKELAKAIALDPKLALAHAALGSITPGEEGKKSFATAMGLAAGLPEAERLSVELFDLQQRGDDNKAAAVRQRLSELAPGDWRVQLALGQYLFFNQWKLEEAAAALRKAAALNPRAGGPLNLLGYVSAWLGRHEEAASAMRKYAETKPGEPNPLDSLGEVLLMASRFDESEAAFRKALQLQPKFHLAWHGIAMGRFFKKDFAGGRDLLAKARDLADRPADKLAMEVNMARSLEAEGKPEEAMKRFEALDRDPTYPEQGRAFLPIDRARLLINTGKAEQAFAHLDEAMKRAGGKLNGAAAGALRRAALFLRLRAQATLGRAAEAITRLTDLEAELAKSPGVFSDSLLHLARGLIALAGKDAKAAADSFERCVGADTFCRYQLVLAREKLGDKPGANAVRAELARTRHRDQSYLWVWAKLGGTL
jgi:Flp pilus assembly protein TadD